MLNHYTCFESGSMRSLKKLLVEKYFVDAGTEGFLGGVTEYQKDALVDAIVREWWVFNGMPTFMQDKKTGRYVRRMLRAHKLLHEAVII
jgi:hypothetical protein